MPKWVRKWKIRKFPWDDDCYWRTEGRKISKDPRNNARQVGMDIEHQTVETDDCHYLKWAWGQRQAVRLVRQC